MKILSVRTSVKDDERVLGIFQLEGQENPVFLTGKQIKAACGLQNNFHLLKGGDLDVEYYKVGDKLINGNECTKDNTIVKEFTLTMPSAMEKLSIAAAVGFTAISI